MRLITKMIFLCLASFVVNSVIAQNSQSDLPESERAVDDQTKLQPEKIDTYLVAKPIVREPATYPRRMSAQNRGGWVDFNFMVDTAGQTYEIEVADHSYGGEDFVNAAQKAISEYEYEPAYLGSQPVDSSSKIRIRFEMTRPREGVTSTFYRRFQNLREAIQNKDEEEASKMLSRLEESKGLSLYDDAYLNLGQYFYHLEFGAEDKQLYFLERAVFDSGQQKYFKTDFYTGLLTNLFVLQVNQKYYWDAMVTYGTLARQEDTYELLTKLDSTMDQIEALQAEQSIFQTNGEISNINGWSIYLINRAFAFDDVDGQIDELKLRCSKKYVFLEYLVDKVYQIPESYGGCRLSVIGSPETRFSLLQGGIDKF